MKRSNTEVQLDCDPDSKHRKHTTPIIFEEGPSFKVTKKEHPGEKDGSLVQLFYQSVTAMAEYADVSFEELRWARYSNPKYSLITYREGEERKHHVIYTGSEGLLDMCDYFKAWADFMGGIPDGPVQIVTEFNVELLRNALHSVLSLGCYKREKPIETLQTLLLIDYLGISRKLEGECQTLRGIGRDVLVHFNEYEIPPSVLQNCIIWLGKESFSYLHASGIEIFDWFMEYNTLDTIPLEFLCYWLEHVVYYHDYDFEKAKLQVLKCFKKMTKAPLPNINTTVPGSEPLKCSLILESPPHVSSKVMAFYNEVTNSFVDDRS